MAMTESVMSVLGELGGSDTFTRDMAAPAIVVQRGEGRTPRCVVVSAGVAPLAAKPDNDVVVWQKMR